MAVIQYSALVTQLRGKLGGSQFNKGHAGYSLQRKSSPTTRQTPAQLKWRQTISLIQRSWKEETAERKNQAAQAAVSNPTKDRFGQQVVLSGYNQYVKMMSWRRLGGTGQPVLLPISDPITTVPVSFAQTSIDNLNVYLLSTEGDTARFSITGDRLLNGTPTGTLGQSRAYIFFTKVDPSGSKLPGARRVFVIYQTAASGAISPTTRPVQSNQYFAVGDFILVEVFTRHLGAGAETGLWSEIIQLQ